MGIQVPVEAAAAQHVQVALRIMQYLRRKGAENADDKVRAGDDLVDRGSVEDELTVARTALPS